MSGVPAVPDPDTILVRSYSVTSAVVYPADTGAVNLSIEGVRNADSTPVTVHLTFEPDCALTASRDLRQAFLAVPLEKRHAR